MPCTRSGTRKSMNESVTAKPLADETATTTFACATSGLVQFGQAKLEQLELLGTALPNSMPPGHLCRCGGNGNGHRRRCLPLAGQAVGAHRHLDRAGGRIGFELLQLTRMDIKATRTLRSSMDDTCGKQPNPTCQRTTQGKIGRTRGNGYPHDKGDRQSQEPRDWEIPWNLPAGLRQKGEPLQRLQNRHENKRRSDTIGEILA